MGRAFEFRKARKMKRWSAMAKTFTRIGKERGWPPVTLKRFKEQNGPLGALMIGSWEEIAEKIIRHSKVLGGISRFTFQMDNAGLNNNQLLKAIELIGNKVAPIVKKHST